MFRINVKLFIVYILIIRTRMEELYNILKLTKANEFETSLIPGANIDGIHAQLTNLIHTSIKKKLCEANLYIKYIKNLKIKHTRTQCINSINLQVYLAYLTNLRTNNEEEFHELTVRQKEEINKYNAEQTKNLHKKQELRDAINKHLLKSFPSNFDAVLSFTQMPNLQFQFLESERIEHTYHLEEKRLMDVNFLKALFNLQVNTGFACRNILQQLGKYNELLDCEKAILRWLFFEDKIEKQLLVSHFPFLLEEQLIAFAILYLNGKLNIAKEKRKLEWINNATIKNTAIDISYSLFSLANYNCDLLQILVNLSGNLSR